MNTKKTKKGKASEPMFSRLDLADMLEDRETVEYFLADALRSNDAAEIARSLGIAARSKGMRQIAKETGLSREQLYRSLSLEGNPTLKTVLAVLNSLGLELTAKAKEMDEEDARYREREAAEAKAKARRPVTA